MEKERRKFKRFDAYMSVNFASHDENEVRGLCLSNDLSRDGIKLSSATEVSKGALMDLNIDIPDDPQSVKTTGEVVWVKKVDSEDDYELGVRFLMMDPVDKFRVLDYAYNNWLETKIEDYSDDPEDIEE